MLSGVARPTRKKSHRQFALYDWVVFRNLTRPIDRLRFWIHMRPNLQYRLSMAKSLPFGVELPKRVVVSDADGYAHCTSATGRRRWVVAAIIASLPTASPGGAKFADIPKIAIRDDVASLAESGSDVAGGCPRRDSGHSPMRWRDAYPVRDMNLRRVGFGFSVVREMDDREA